MHNRFSDLQIFLTDPNPWSDVSEKKSPILPHFSFRQCKQNLFTVTQPEPEDKGGFYPPESEEKKTYDLFKSKKQPVDQKKYGAVIECQEPYPLAYDQLWPNRPVWIYSAVRMMVVCEKDTPLVVRYPPVPGSILFHREDEQECTLPDSVWIDTEQHLVCQESGFVSYAPILKMQVHKVTLCTKEWEDLPTWKLELISC